MILFRWKTTVLQQSFLQVKLAFILMSFFFTTLPAAPGNGQKQNKCLNYFLGKDVFNSFTSDEVTIFNSLVEKYVKASSMPHSEFSDLKIELQNGILRLVAIVEAKGFSKPLAIVSELYSYAISKGLKITTSQTVHQIARAQERAALFQSQKEQTLRLEAERVKKLAEVKRSKRLKRIFRETGHENIKDAFLNICITGGEQGKGLKDVIFLLKEIQSITKSTTAIRLKGLEQLADADEFHQDIADYLLKSLIKRNVSASQLSNVFVDSAKGANVSFMQSLLNLGVDVNVKKFGTVTALSRAAMGQDRLAVVELLIRNGIENTESSAKGKYTSPLRMALLMDNAELVPLILSLGGKEEGLDKDGKAAIHDVVDGVTVRDRNLSFNLLQLFLTHHLDPNIRGANGETPLMTAAKGNPDIKVLALLIKGGAEIDATDVNRKVALNYAMDGRNSAAMQFLNTYQGLRTTHNSVQLKAYLDSILK